MLAKITRDTHTLMSERLGFTQADKDDLEECLRILNSDEPLAFDWEVDAYKLEQLPQAGAPQEGVALPAVAKFRALVAEKKVAVGEVAAFRADDEECVWLGRVKALHEATSEFDVHWLHRGSVAHGKKLPDPPQHLAEAAKKRVYYHKRLAQGETFDRVHSDTLQTGALALSGGKTFHALDAASAKAVQFYIDQIIKTREQSQREDDKLRRCNG